MEQTMNANDVLNMLIEEMLALKDRVLAGTATSADEERYLIMRHAIAKSV